MSLVLHCVLIGLLCRSDSMISVVVFMKMTYCYAHSPSSTVIYFDYHNCIKFYWSGMEPSYHSTYMQYLEVDLLIQPGKPLNTGCYSARQLHLVQVVSSALLHSRNKIIGEYFVRANISFPFPSLASPDTPLHIAIPSFSRLQNILATHNKQNNTHFWRGVLKIVGLISGELSDIYISGVAHASS